MSRVADEKKYPPKQAKPTTKPATGGKRPYTFHPTEAQRVALRENPVATNEALTVVSEYLERGCKMTLGYKAENAAFFAILRENTAVWDEGEAVSVFHSQPEKCLAGLAFYLLHVNPEWPRANGGWTQTNFDW